jgi:hypothetical protein
MQNNQSKKNIFQSSNPYPGFVFYEIKIQGRLDPQRSKWFEGMTLTYIEKGEGGLACTLISGPVIDQSALHGLLTKIRNLNLTLISVQSFVPGTNTLDDVLNKSEPS